MDCSQITCVSYYTVMQYEIFKAKFHVIMYKSFIKIGILELKLQRASAYRDNRLITRMFNIKLYIGIKKIL